MVIEFSGGKLIVTPFELVIRLQGENCVSLQAGSESIELIGQGANVVVANSGDTRWSVKLDNEAQLLTIAGEMGCDIR